jgi:hypothetical protein
MTDFKVEPIQPIHGLTNDKHNINYRASDLTHKGPALDNVTKSFNDVLQDLKNETFNHDSSKTIRSGD